MKFTKRTNKLTAKIDFVQKIQEFKRAPSQQWYLLHVQHKSDKCVVILARIQQVNRSNADADIDSCLFLTYMLIWLDIGLSPFTYGVVRFVWRNFVRENIQNNSCLYRFFVFTVWSKSRDSYALYRIGMTFRLYNVMCVYNIVHVFLFSIWEIRINRWKYMMKFKWLQENDMMNN